VNTDEVMVHGRNRKRVGQHFGFFAKSIGYRQGRIIPLSVRFIQALSWQKGDVCVTYRQGPGLPIGKPIQCGVKH